MQKNSQVLLDGVFNIWSTSPCISLSFSASSSISLTLAFIASNS